MGKEIGASVTTRLSSLSTTTEYYFFDSNLSVNNMLSTIDRYMISPTLMAFVFLVFVLDNKPYNPRLFGMLPLEDYFCTCVSTL